MKKELLVLGFMAVTSCTSIPEGRRHYYEIANSGERAWEYLETAAAEDSVNLYLVLMRFFPPPLSIYADMLVAERPDAVEVLLRKIRLEEDMDLVQFIMLALARARYFGTLSRERAFEHREALARAAARDTSRGPRLVDRYKDRVLAERPPFPAVLLPYYEIAQSDERTRTYLKTAAAEECVTLYLQMLTRFWPPRLEYADLLAQRRDVVEALLRTITVETHGGRIEHAMYALARARSHATLSYSQALAHREAFARTLDRFTPGRRRDLVISYIDQVLAEKPGDEAPAKTSP